MFMVNGLPVDGEPGLVQLIDLAQREVFRSFGDAVEAPTRCPRCAAPATASWAWSPSRAAGG